MALPYAGGSIPDGLVSVASQGLLSANGATIAAAVAIYLASVQDPNGLINVTTFSGGAQAFSSAMTYLPGLKDRIGNVTYVSPGATGSLFKGKTTTAVIGTNGRKERAVTATGRLNLPDNTNIIYTRCGHDFFCQIQNAPEILWNAGSPCPLPVTISSPRQEMTNFPFNNVFGPFGQHELVYSTVQYTEVTTTIRFDP